MVERKVEFVNTKSPQETTVTYDWRETSGKI